MISYTQDTDAGLKGRPRLIIMMRPSDLAALQQGVDVALSGGRGFHRGCFGRYACHRVFSKIEFKEHLNNYRPNYKNYIGGNHDKIRPLRRIIFINRDISII